MRVRLAGTIALAAALSGCGGQRVPAVDRHLPAAIATPPNDAALLRISRGSGTAELLRANTLIPRPGSAINGLPAMARILGASGSEDETAYGTDNAGHLVAIDLKNQRSRIMTTSARQFTATADGTILGVDSARHPMRLVNRAFTMFKDPVDRGTVLLRGPADQIIAVGNRPGMIQVLGASGEIRHIPAPNGRVAGTWVGDLVAVATDSGVAFVDPSGKAPPRKAPPRFVKVRGTPTVAAFSPSGHRLYVARKNGGLVMLDRFSHRQLKDLPLSGTVDGLRADRSGRWLLAHGTVDDSLWAIDVTRWTVTWSGAAPWAEDLPQVVDGRLLLSRRKSDLVATDLVSPGSPVAGVLAGGAVDLYIMLPWIPKAAPNADAVATVVTSPANPATAAPGVPAQVSSAAGQGSPSSGQVPPGATTRPASPAGTIYLQVSSSQNADWAQALAKQLKDGGFPAKVLEPKTSDESYRVVVGPYGSRTEADEVGKRLGRPYFIITPGTGDT